MHLDPKYAVACRFNAGNGSPNHYCLIIQAFIEMFYDLMSYYRYSTGWHLSWHIPCLQFPGQISLLPADNSLE